MTIRKTTASDQDKTPESDRSGAKTVRHGVKRVTLRDVARVAGVHVSTVSRVINSNDTGMVSESVGERIRQIAKEMGYIVNPVGHALKTQKSSTIGVLVPDLTNPLFPPVFRAIEKALREEGYTAILGDTDNDPGQERNIVDKMKGRLVDGLIFATAQKDDEVISQTMREGIPVVLVNRTSRLEKAAWIGNDDREGMRLVVNHLAGLGHTAIAHLAGPHSVSIGRERHEGFLRGMAELGLTADPDLVEIADAYGEAAGYRAMMAVLERGAVPTAVVAANDLLAVGCYRALADRGLRCPQDVSVTGHNNMPFTDIFSPPLTTVEIDLYRMGQEAAKMLLSLIRDPQAEAPHIVMEPKLIVRASTAPPPL